MVFVYGGLGGRRAEMLVELAEVDMDLETEVEVEVEVNVDCECNCCRAAEVVMKYASKSGRLARVVRSHLLWPLQSRLSDLASRFAQSAWLLDHAQRTHFGCSRQQSLV